MNLTSRIAQNQTPISVGHTFSAKEKDEETGYSYFGARYYDSELSVWLSVDALATKYPSNSSYMYVLGNPIRLTDPNGDSAVVLKAPAGAHGEGHMAMLIQNSEGKWALWSKNGTNESSGMTGPSDKKDDRGTKTFNSPEEFMKSDANLNSEGKREYTEGYLISATKDEDRKMEAGFKSELAKSYNVVTANCAQAVQSALTNAGFSPGNYPGVGDVFLPESPLTNKYIELGPNRIYDRIRRDNLGGKNYKSPEHHASSINYLAFPKSTNVVSPKVKR